MESLLNSMSPFEIGLSFVLVCLVLSLIGLFLFKKISEKEHIKRSSESFVALVSIIAILYAVLLAFIVVVAWENYDNTGNNVDDEANMIASVYRDAGVLEDTVSGHQIQRQMMIYDSLIYTKEWKTMGKGKAAPEIGGVVSTIFKIFKNYEEIDSKDDVVFSETFHGFNKVQECRRIRLLNSHKQIPFILWFVIIAGTVITLCFTFFFHFEHFMTKAIFTSLIAVMMALTMFLIYYLNHPYKGTGVTSEPFEIIHRVFSKK